MVAYDRIRWEGRRDKIITRVLAGLMMALFAMDAHAGESLPDQYRWELFQVGKINAVRVDVDDEHLIGNAKELKRDVELVLMRKQVPLRTPPEEELLPYLTASLQTVPLGDGQGVTYLVDVQLRKPLPIAVEGWFLPVGAWKSIWFGTTNKRDLPRNARDQLLNLVEAFADDYTKANSLEAYQAYAKHSGAPPAEPTVVDQTRDLQAHRRAEPVAAELDQPTEE